MISMVIFALATDPKSLIKQLEDSEMEGRTENIPTTSIVQISLNTEKGPEDLRRLVVTGTPKKVHQLTLL